MLALTSSLEDMHLAKMVVATSHGGQPITTEDLVSGPDFMTGPFYYISTVEMNELFFLYRV